MAAIAGAVTLLTSSVAQAYPDCGIALSLNNSTLEGGQSFKYTADAGTVDCDWTVTYAGKSKTGSGTSISGSFGTEVVTKKTTSKITASCEHATGVAPASAPTQSSDAKPAFYSTGSSAVLQAADDTVDYPTSTCPVSATVTLLPKGVSDAGDGILPNTGGSSLWILLAGGALIMAGGGVTLASRRRHQTR
ncbi:LPXTG cell wall anchor domain-containing protein [Aeromicrobium sp. A1-2]|uniref:LPXTG cell wall anchor domain-containing protein n=1 Tax=Aeromicrobium sp. A1-2 TaxID=2107713 RepID=UPI0013C37906|nr:LPXTG cell wall anchor domain-containing protein [Aeromicrobium sp. A1-2]